MQRLNRHGLQFTITEVVDGFRRSLRIETRGKTIVITVPFEVFSQSWYNWTVKGDFIQDAFSYLNADEREFLMTGLLPLEFKEATEESNDTE